MTSRTPRPSPRQGDIARHLGINRSTVSRALDPERAHLVSAETKAKVIGAAQALGYQMNGIARSLRTQRSSIVGVLIPDITNPIYPRVVRGIEDTLESEDYASLVAYTDGRHDLAADRIRRMRERGVDGFVIATARWRDSNIEALVRDGVPLVQVNRQTHDRAVPSVTVARRSGLLDVVAHLLELGHERIGYVGSSLEFSTGRSLDATFEKALGEAGVGCPPGAVRIARVATPAEGERVALEVLAAHPATTALVAANDVLAMGCVDAVRSAGRRCPDDVSVVGFDNVPYSERFNPALTTVDFDHYGMGASAAAMLLRQLRESDHADISHIIMGSRLVVRDSTAAPPQGA